ncbi:hypothetical protein ACQ4PT_047555 [Festuca glaucescens]
MADSLVNSAMLKLEGMAFNTVKQQTEVGKRAQGLKDDLAWLQLLLRGADQRRRREINEYIELWVRQTREVAFDAEDLLDEYLHEGQLHCRGVLDLPSFLRWLRHSATGLFVRQSICSDIDAIKARLEQIKKKTEDNSVQLQMSLPTTATSDKRRKRYVDWDAPSGGHIDNLVGINEKLMKIKDCLKNPGETRQRTLVAIMGKSGAGKTTLAGCVYESSEVRALFHYIIWIHLPQKFRLVDVIADMVRQTTFPGMELDPEKDVHEKDVYEKDIHKKDVHDISKLTKSLTERLRSNKYLIVLDNVRSLDELKLFLSVLPECEGSAVLITTEIKPHHTASDTCGKLKNLFDHQVVLKKLEKKEARKMFCTRLFGKASFDNNVKNATHARTIEDLLDKSLPLACTLLAGLLRTKKEEVWTDIINQLMQQRHKLEQQKQNQEKVQEKQQQQLEEGREEMKRMNQQEREKEKPAGRQEVLVQAKQQKDKKESGQEDSLLEKQQMIEEEQEVNQPAGPQEEMKNQQREQQEAIEYAHVEGEKEPEQQQQKHVYRQMSLLDQILMLSFDDLPPQLKQCFLYFSAFKAEEHINADKLIRLWVAEGLVRPTDGRTAEKHGRDHLRTLISRCLVNLVKKDYSNNIISVSIHQRVITFARSEAREINFLQVHHSTSDLPSTAIRRLSVRNAFNPHTRLALATPKLRSLLCECPEAPYADDGSTSCTSHIRKAWEYIGGRVISLNIHQCKFLRVVDLQGMVHRSTLPYEIGWLIYLQYLGLARTGLKKLPRSIKNLHSLQTLDISNTKIKHVPKGLWKIKALRHVLAEQLENGPTNTNALHSLQTLHTVQCKGSALKKLINLRSLRLWGIDKKLMLEDCLGRMECLKFLDLAAKDGVELPLVNMLTMFGLRSLQHLKLDGQVSKEGSGKVPAYLLHKLTKLELQNSGMEQEHINLIAKVPNLAGLILGKDSYTGKEMKIPMDGFPELKELQINNLGKLTNWTFAQDVESAPAGSTLKQLQQVSILNCTELRKIPDELTTLEHLVLLAVHNSPVNFPSKVNFQSAENLSIKEENEDKA